MIEICTIPKDLFKIFFDWPMTLQKNGLNLNVDDNIWYCISNTSNTSMIRGKLNVPVKSKVVLSVDPSKLLKSATTDITFFMEDNVLIYKTANGEHRINTLVDPKIQTRTLPPNVVYPITIELKRNNLNDLTEEVLKVVGSKKDSNDDYILFIYNDKKLTVSNSDVDDKHLYNFPDEYSLEGSYKSEFSIDLITEIMKYYKEFETCLVSMGTNIPIKFEFKNELVEFTTIAAPRIN